MPDVQGFTCGVKEGEPFCTLSTGKGEALEIDPSSLAPEERRAAFDAKRPNSCPPERWNWFWTSCCPPGKHFDGQRSCVPNAAAREFVLPPASAPPEKGDFPLPAGELAYA